jgi:hypothetical protein
MFPRPTTEDAVDIVGENARMLDDGGIWQKRGRPGPAERAI